VITQTPRKRSLAIATCVNRGPVYLRRALFRRRSRASSYQRSFRCYGFTPNLAYRSATLGSIVFAAAMSASPPGMSCRICFASPRT
jgi:hypothetical protein